MAKKGKPKHDHAAIQQGFVATTDEGPAARTRTQLWLADPDNVARLLATVSGGQSVRRFCESEGISYSPVQRALVSTHEAAYRQAQEDMAEHLMGEIERISIKLERGELDPKAAAVILDGLKWRISKLNQRRYSDRQIVEQHVVDHAKIHRQALRELASRPRPVIEGEVLRHRLTQEPASELLRRSQADAASPPVTDAVLIPKE